MRLQNGIDGAGRLPQPTHPSHAIEKCRSKMCIAEEVVIQEIKMPSRKTVDLAKRRIHSLGIKRPAAFEKRFLIAKVADVRTSARYDDRVGHEVKMPFDEITTNRRHVHKRACA